MIEPEMAFYQLDELTALEEEFIKYCVKWALDHCMDDLEFLNKMIDNGLIERLKGVIDTDFVRLPYTEGIKILEEAVAKGHKFEFPVSWGVDLASEHERYLVEQHFKKPVTARPCRAPTCSSRRLARLSVVASVRRTTTS